MRLRITVEGTTYDVDVEVLDPGPGMSAVPTRPAAGAPTPSAPQQGGPPVRPVRQPAGQADEKAVRSPVAGTVQSVRIKPGDQVAINDTLLVLEAMKMESSVASPAAGKVAEVLVKQGDVVTAGQTLVRFE